MSKRIIIDGAFSKQARVALLSSNNIIEDIEYEVSSKQQLKGNIYLAKITRIEPSLQAAFIDYGGDKGGFLPFTEINPDYYHIPVSDQKAPIATLKEMTQPKITSEDLAEKNSGSHKQELKDDIDIKNIEKLIDDKVPTEFELDVSENDIEHFSNAKNDNFTKNYNIQEVIKKGQIMLVQVVKEERGNKGASFTSFISLAGKYCVLMPNKPFQNGVSRKISNSEERRRIKNLISELNVESDKNTASVIARTAATGRTTLELKRDYDYLIRLWNKIREVTLKATAPSFIHEEEGIIQKTIRNMFDHKVKEMLVQGNAAYNSALKFLKDILPTETHRLKEYKEITPIFTKLNIEEQLSNLYQPIISLPSGGYIVINPTEALISIDVNSGKATSERNIEETALKTNLEAAREISRQIKLRDLSGLIVIDFIDMNELKNRRIIERSMKEFLSSDRARIQVANISSLGLLEISRQRMRPSFLESNSTICSHCNGKGLVRADEPNSMLVLRTVENELANDNVETINVYASMNSVVYLLNNKRLEIASIENKYKVNLNFYYDPNATSDSYSIEKIRANKKHNNLANKPLLQNISDIYQEDNITDQQIKTTSADEQNVSNKNKRKWKNNSYKTELNNNSSVKDRKEVKDDTREKTGENTEEKAKTKTKENVIEKGKEKNKDKKEPDTETIATDNKNTNLSSEFASETAVNNVINTNDEQNKDNSNIEAIIDDNVPGGERKRRTHKRFHHRRAKKNEFRAQAKKEEVSE